MKPLDKLRDKLASGSGKILVIQTAFLGDVILTTPLLRAVRNSYPKAGLAVVVLPQFEEIVSPFVDQIFSFDKRVRESLSRNWNELIERLISEQFDLALIPHRSVRSAMTAKRAGIEIRIGFRRGVGSLLHSHRVAYPYNLYEGLRNLELLKPLIHVSDSGLPELRPTEEIRTKVFGMLDSAGLRERSFVVIAPGSVWLTKRWVKDYYIELIRLLESEYGLPVVAIGGKEDVELCDGIVSNQRYNFAGKLSVLDSAALISQSRLLISGDSAPAHIATSVKARQVIIFGSTTRRFGFAPQIDRCRIMDVDLWCRPCTNHGRNRCPTGTLACMKSIKPTMVTEYVEDWLEDD